MVIDGKEGCTVLDSDIAAFLRKQDVPVVLAVNKCESHVQGDLQAADFWGLGLGDPIPVRPRVPDRVAASSTWGCSLG